MANKKKVKPDKIEQAFPDTKFPPMLKPKRTPLKHPLHGKMPIK